MSRSNSPWPSPAPLQGAGVLVAGAILACALASRGRALPEVLAIVCWGNLTLASLAVAACLARARRVPAEARGWRLAALSQLLFGLMNLWILATHGDLVVAAGLTGLNILQFLVLLAAIVAWPWRDRGGRRWPRHALGSLLFSGSILFALWGLGSWTAAAASSGLLNRLVLANALRITLVGGVVLFLISERPSRARGPLGWLLANMVAAGVVGALAKVLLEAGHTWVLPFGSLALLSPASLLLGALSPHPVESPGQAGLREGRWLWRWELLPYLPFALATATLVWVTAVHSGPLLGTLAAYIGLTALLVLRQILLLAELREANRTLDARVQERTRQLETLQEVVLRTERLNALSVMGAGLVHDLNNALTVVYGTLDLAAPLPGTDPELHRQTVGRIQEALGRVTSLGARLMAFIRQKEEPEAGVDLGDSLRGMRDILRMALPASVELQMAVPDGPLPVQVTPSHLEQILMNLVINARDAMPEGGRVRLAVVAGGEADPSWVELTVEDTGTGMPPTVLDQLFTPFFTTKQVGKGTGLGLASVKALMERAGGSIEVWSRPGAGTRFRLRFPVGSPAEATVG